ncbi:MAG: hypothetical protein WA979_00450 [Pacificimonas sp.]
MNDFIYSVWFLDTNAYEGDQDQEWVACIGIRADTATEAQSCGDALAMERTRRNPQDAFIKSSVAGECEMDGDFDCSSLPRITAGQIATDADLGW